MDIYAVLNSIDHNTHYLVKYISFINKCQSKNENLVLINIEKHHICPKALFPEYSNFSVCPWNMIKLTPRQHYIAHVLLWKTFPDSSSQANSVWFMKNNGLHKMSSRLFESLRSDQRRAVSASIRGTVAVIDVEGNKFRVPVDDVRFTSGLLKALSSKKRSKESIENIRKSKIGQKASIQTKEKLSTLRKGSGNPRYGAILTEDTKNKISVTLKNAPLVYCPHCNFSCRSMGAMKRHHFDNCKLKG